MDRGGIKNVDLVSKSIKQNIAAIESRQQITIREAFAGISGQHTRCVKYPYYVFVGRDGEIREEDAETPREHEQCAGSRWRNHYTDYSPMLYR